MNFSPTKRRLLSLLREKGRISQGSALEIPRRSDSGACPLSFAQERIWLFEQLEPGTTAYVVPTATRIMGNLNLDVLWQSLREIVRRHEVLRTTFTIVDEVAAQVPNSSEPPFYSQVDLRAYPPAEREKQVRRYAESYVMRPFDLTRGPLIRAALLQLDEEEFILFLILHHIVTDGWSLKILIRELAALYLAFSRGERSPLRELPIQYADFAVWQRHQARGEELRRQLAYWKRQLAHPRALVLPTDGPSPQTPGLSGATESIFFTESLTQALNEFSRRQGVTLFIALYAAFQVLLFRYTWQEEIVMGTPVANRNRSELEGVIGFFVNTLALRTDLSGNPSFLGLLSRSREVTLSAYDHQDLPFDLLVSELRPARALGQVPLFRVFFALNNNPAPAFVLPDLILCPMPLHNGIAKFDLEVSLVEIEGRLKGTIIYKVGLFSASTVQKLLKRFELILEQVVADPERRLLEFRVDEDEQATPRPRAVFQSHDHFAFE
jgi:Condensation domain